MQSPSNSTQFNMDVIDNQRPSSDQVSGMGAFGASDIYFSERMHMQVVKVYC